MSTCHVMSWRNTGLIVDLFISGGNLIRSHMGSTQECGVVFKALFSR